MNSRIAAPALFLLLLLSSSGAVAQAVPMPHVTPLRITEQSRPFLAASQTREPVNLSARGYVEEEFLISGAANIYDWSPGGPSEPVRVRTAGVPYTTRFLLRRPVDAKKFSGRVIVELLNPTNRYDIAPIWGLAHEHFLRSGDIYVGLTVKPVAMDAMKKFNAERYAKLSFHYQQPANCPAAALPQGPLSANYPDSENGLVWDVISQTGALLRSSGKDSPLKGYRVRELIGAGYSQTGSFINTYVTAMHAHARIGDTNRPLYDGYFAATAAAALSPLNQCSAPLVAPDWHMPKRDVPLIAVLSQTDVVRSASRRRPDSDAPDDRYRQYELAGVGHDGPWDAGRPTLADLKVVGIVPYDPAIACAEPPTNMKGNPSYHAIWSLLDKWISTGAAPPPSRLVKLDAQGKIVVDAQGNAVGGWRSPAVDVPLAAYSGTSTPAKPDDPGARTYCSSFGSMQRFDAARLRSLYGGKAEYVRQFDAAAARLVKDHMLLPADVPALQAAAAKVQFPH